MINALIDLTANRLDEVLAAYDLTPAQLTEDAAKDPYGPAAHRVESIADTEKRLPIRFRDAILDHKKITEWAEEVRLGALAAQSKTRALHAFAAPGRSLLLLGPTGTGKTHQSYAAFRHIAAGDVRTQWQAITAPGLYALMRPRHGIDSEAEFARYAEARMLLLDDVGAAKPSEWTEEVNYRLVNHRYEHALPTLFTTNLTPKHLREILGDRVCSRLVEMCEFVPMKGDDRRRGTS